MLDLSHYYQQLLKSLGEKLLGSCTIGIMLTTPEPNVNFTGTKREDTCTSRCDGTTSTHQLRYILLTTTHLLTHSTLAGGGGGEKKPPKQQQKTRILDQASRSTNFQKYTGWRDTTKRIFCDAECEKSYGTIEFLQ